MLLTTLAYVGLFHLFAVAFRYSTIVAIVYSLLVEVLLGHAGHHQARGRELLWPPDVCRRRPDGLAPPDPHWFEPFSPVAAQWTLVGFFVVALAIAMIIFDAPRIQGSRLNTSIHLRA